LVYAIGEIVLVVIGILIALQINNWNENRKDRMLEKDLLKEINLGLNYDLEKLTISIDKNRSYLRSQDIILHWLKSNLEYSDSLSNHFVKAMFCDNLLSKDGPFESLKQIGMRIITNDSVRNQISNLYDLDYQELYWWENTIEQTKTNFQNTLTDHQFDFFHRDGEKYGRMQPINSLTIKSDKAFILKLELFHDQLFYYTNTKMVDIKKSIERTIKIINAETTE